VLEADRSGRVVLGLVTLRLKVAVFRKAEAVFLASNMSEIVISFVWFGDVVTLGPSFEMDLSLLGARVARGKLEEEERADVLDMSALRCRLANRQGLNTALADLEATALKSVPDLLKLADLVVTTGTSSAGLKSVTTGREGVCGKLQVRFFFFALGELRSAGAERDRLFLGCRPLPLFSGAYM